MPEPDERFTRQLRDLADGAAHAARPLAASAVRALGVRRRQRRIALVAGLASAAVVAAATVALGSTQNNADIAPATPTPSPVPTPESGWLQEIPANFVVDAKPLPVTGEFDPRRGESIGRQVTDVTICDAPFMDGDRRPIDALGVVTELTWRGVQLYEDDMTAREQMAAFVTAAARCPAGDSGASRYTWSVEALDPSGPADVVVTQTVEDGAVLWYQLAQRGNALAVVQTVPQPRARALGKSALTGLVKQMCVFTHEGCGLH